MAYQYELKTPRKQYKNDDFTHCRIIDGVLGSEIWMTANFRSEVHLNTVSNEQEAIELINS